MIESVAEGLQTLEESLDSGEIPDRPTVAAKMKRLNDDIETVCSEINAAIRKLPTYSNWLDDDDLEYIKKDIKSMLQFIRKSKGVAKCMECQGDGCNACRDEGFVNKITHDQS